MTTLTRAPLNNSPVILYDGVCNLCNSSVQFVIRRDPAARFRFASLQSSYGRTLLKEYTGEENLPGSFILYEEGKIYTRSTAALKTLYRLRGWGWTKILLYVPAFLRNFVYDLIAKNRYSWFGKKESCWLPSPNLQERFIDWSDQGI